MFHSIFWQKLYLPTDDIKVKAVSVQRPGYKVRVRQPRVPAT